MSRTTLISVMLTEQSDGSVLAARPVNVDLAVRRGGDESLIAWLTGAGSLWRWGIELRGWFSPSGKMSVSQLPHNVLPSSFGASVVYSVQSPTRLLTNSHVGVVFTSISSSLSGPTYEVELSIIGGELEPLSRLSEQTRL